jgi:hypothetical protein
MNQDGLAETLKEVAEQFLNYNFSAAIAQW